VHPRTIPKSWQTSKHTSIWIPLPIHWHAEWWELMMWSTMIMMSTFNLLTSPLSSGTPCPIVTPMIGLLFVCLDRSNLDVMWGSDFNVVLAVDLRVMSSALIGVLPLGTYIIFLLLSMTLIACRLILLNDIEISSFGLVFWPVSLLATTLGNNSFSNSCPQY
jgi:hypothetical protein